jgi:hypothetical protein
MTEQLKSKIEIKIKRSIRTRGDCQYLSNLISADLNIEISYNTLRRFFGVESNTKIKASNSTLNILSKFIGHKTFEDFQNNLEWSWEWESQLKSNILIDDLNEKKIITNLKLLYHENKNFTVIFVSIIRELFLLNEIALVNKIFKISTFNFEKLTYSEILYIGTGIGSIFRKIKLEEKTWVLLLKNKKIVDHIFLAFVDYSAINGYYGDLFAIYQKNDVKLRNDQNLFFTAFDKLKQLLNKKNVESMNYFQIKKDKLHPILIGRLASIEIITKQNKRESYDQVFLDLENRIKSSKKDLFDFTYELVTISLVTKNFQLMEWISSFEAFDLREQYQLSHQQYLLIMIACLKIKKGEDLAVIKIINGKIDSHKFRLSYSPFYQLFHLICLYNSSKNKLRKEKLHKEYNKLKTSLNIPLFDDPFLISYFD